MTGNILIIDDEEQLRKLLARIISLEGFKTEEASTLRAASAKLDQHEFDVILCDVKLPDGNGVEFVKSIKARFPLVEAILITAYGNIADGVQAIKNGAFDYITKGDDNERVIPLLHQAMEKSIQGKKDAVRINRLTRPDFERIISKNSKIKTAIELARKIAVTNASVLLLGETGTGKEVFAQAIHQVSKRNKNSFIAINCSAFPKELLEGELFGHKAGAYTGATKDKKGLVEMADTGTLFLDEIGEMNIDLQAKILRLVENGEFIKLGDTRTSKVDLRIIAATNRDLKKEIESGLFRQDLYYRLNVFTIELPSLRDRSEDIPLLTKCFLDEFAFKFGKSDMQIDNDALELLKKYKWDGNIRELRNVLERAVILASGKLLHPEDLPYEIQKQDAKLLHELSLAAVEREHIRKILQHTNGNKARAARLLEIGLATLYRKIEEYGIESTLSK